MPCDPQTLASLAPPIEAVIPAGMQLPILLASVCSMQTTANASFVSQLFPLTANGAVVWSANHGLGATPSQVRAVLVATANDANTGLVIGDEVPASPMWFILAGVSTQFVIGANSTAVFGAFRQLLEARNKIVPKGGGAVVSPSAISNFSLKFYARL